MTPAQTIGQRLRFYRMKAGLEQAELGAPLFSGSYISMIERGERSPSIKAAAFLAKKLRIPVAELLDPCRLCKCGAAREPGQRCCHACTLEARAARWRANSVKKLQGAARG